MVHQNESRTHLSLDLSGESTFALPQVGAISTMSILLSTQCVEAARLFREVNSEN